MVFSLLFELWSSTNLIVAFGEDVCRLPCIVVLAGRSIELLHHIKELVVVPWLNPWILDDKTPIFVQGFCDLLAVLDRVVGLSEEPLHINDGY